MKDLHSQPVMARPLPIMGNNDPYWNTETCLDGRRCTNRNCKNFHSDVEKRCQYFVQRNCWTQPGKSCVNGLHLPVPNDRWRSFEVDLESPANAFQLLQFLESQTPEDRAMYVRLVICGFAVVRVNFLKRFICKMPMLSELLLPDRAKNPTILVYLCDMVETLSRTNPRLCNVIFEDGSEELLW